MYTVYVLYSALSLLIWCTDNQVSKLRIDDLFYVLDFSLPRQWYLNTSVTISLIQYVYHSGLQHVEQFIMSLNLEAYQQSLRKPIELFFCAKTCISTEVSK